jgi:hypothetical protein
MIDMNTHETTGTTPQVIDMLESTEADLAKYREDMDHGKASVIDRFEELKKEIEAAIKQMKITLAENKSLARNVAETLRVRLADLEERIQVHASRLSSAELEEQLNRLRGSMENLITYLGTLDLYDFSLANIQDKVYRFRIKLDILGLKFQLGALQVKEVVFDTRHDFKKKLHTLRTKVEQSEEDLEKRWGVFRHEIAAAYEHLQKAFTSK